MTDAQWDSLRKAVEGTLARPLSAFIIDCPWLPKWHGVSMLDYFGSDETWFEANKAAIERFPDAAFIPGVTVESRSNTLWNWERLNLAAGLQSLSA